MKLLSSFLAFAPLLAAAEEVDNTSGGGLSQVVLMIGMAIAFFYFIMRPEQKRRKASEEMRAALKKGDRVTAMGIVGTVVRLQEHTVVLRMVEGAKIEMLRAAITDVQPGNGKEDIETADILGER